MMESNPWFVDSLTQFQYYCCPECDDKLKEQQDLIKHAYDKHPKAIEAFEAKFTLGKPAHTEEATRTIECDHCSELFNKKAALKRHLSIHHLLQDQFSCKNCQLKCDGLNSFSQHKKTCRFNEMEVYKCPKCDLLSKSKSLLKLHLQENHDIINCEVCGICGLIISKSKYLKRHIESVHLKLKNHVCHLCGKGFSRPVALKEHISRVHEMAGKYACSKCTFQAMSSKELEVHVNGSHEKRVRFQCNQCQFASFRKGGLQTHIKIVHEKYKPNKCEMCPCAFVAKRDLIKHREKKH